jgi:hypothetical protein
MSSEISPGELRLLVVLMLWPLWVLALAVPVVARVSSWLRKK